MTVEQPHEEPKHYLLAHIREALAGVNELNVDVTVAGRKVFLTGQVATPERQEVITAVVRELLPEYEIHNETSLPELAEPADAEELS